MAWDPPDMLKEHMRLHEANMRLIRQIRSAAINTSFFLIEFQDFSYNFNSFIGSAESAHSAVAVLCLTQPYNKMTPMHLQHVKVRGKQYWISRFPKIGH